MDRASRILSILLVVAVVASGCIRALKVDSASDSGDSRAIDGDLHGESEDCDCQPDGLSDDSVAPPDTGPRERPPALDNGCVDTDSADNYLKAGYVVYTDENGLLVLLYDECKLEGPSGMLKEVTCNGYHGPETTPAEMEAKYIKCHCHQGECIEDSVILCTDPDANTPYPGGSVWTNEEGKTHISVCLDSTTVDWYYCNEDGTFHSDASACDPGIQCGDGMCGGFVCTDTEPPSDRIAGIAGQIFLYSPTTGESWLITDGCSFDLTTVNSFTCPLHTGTALLALKEAVKLNPILIPCAADEKCEFGACKHSGVNDPDPGPTPETCMDDDPGDDVYKSGEVVYTPEGGQPQFYPDKCSWYYEEDPTDPGKLLIKTKVLQYQCEPDDKGITSSSTDCLDGEPCIASACLGETTVEESCDFKCVDSDGGKDVMVGGFVYATSDTCGQTGAIYDSCIDNSHVVKERYCAGNLLAKKNISCPQGYFCRTAFEYASCIACKDSDEEDAPGILGQVDDIDGSHVTDFCNAAGELKQVKCDPKTGLAVWGDPEQCAPGENCSEGKCY